MDYSRPTNDSRSPFAKNGRLRACSVGCEKQAIVSSMVKLVLVYKTKTEQKPVFLSESLSKPFQIRTRAASTGVLVDNLKTTNVISKFSYETMEHPTTTDQVSRKSPEVQIQAENLGQG